MHQLTRPFKKTGDEGDEDDEPLTLEEIYQLSVFKTFNDKKSIHIIIFTLKFLHLVVFLRM